jgi:GNAT superfamily N-acetyltransferase
VLRLSHLFVAPAHRRRGVGSALVEAALARDGVEAVELIAHEANTGAITFWHAQGFSITPMPGMVWHLGHTHTHRVEGRSAIVERRRSARR